ncbi:MAG: RsmD family RNA methyltransferase [Planctomycetales bacterium]|nr:RsmD family RNA methyltransferase [Planctomycetales bacterium]
MGRSHGFFEHDDEKPKLREFQRTRFAPSKLRIVAGEMRGRKIEYNGDPATRPMKDRTRESLFSLLGGDLSNTVAIDLFGGTGILAFESISRGAERAIILELSRATVTSILQNIELLRISSQVDVHNVDTFRWLKGFEPYTQTLPQLPWIIFCCPPYRLWTEQGERLADGLRRLFDAAPEESVLVCETESTFDIRELLPDKKWDVRTYSPAHLALATKLAADAIESSNAQVMGKPESKL